MNQESRIKNQGKFKSIIHDSLFMIHFRGFTLIELLIVIAVLGVLASVIITAIDPQGQLKKARNAARKNDLRQMADAVERYKIADPLDRYPSTGMVWCGEPDTPHPSCGADWIPGLVAAGELKKLPRDPQHLNPSCRSYLYRSNATDFKILAHCPEEPLSSTDPFFDPARPTWAWQVSSPGGVGW